MLKDKVALITGGGTGIGRAIALSLAQQGAHLAVNYSRSAADAQKTCAECAAFSVKAISIQADVGADEQVRAMVDKTVTALGGIDILVNCAGVTNFVEHADMDGLSDEYWDRAMNINVKGVFRVCRAAYPHLKERRGCIISITSVAGLTGLGSSIAYAASKAAAISLTKSLARVMAPEVRVNSIAPGIVLTRWVEGHEDHVERLSADTPMQRVAGPEDVAEVALGLIGQAGFVTGQTIVVDGGMFI